jgi:hypothetical protein
VDLVALFDSIPSPSETSGDVVRFAAEPIPGFGHYHVARDLAGDPALLISGIEASQDKPAPIVLEHLTVQAGLDCAIQRLDGQRLRERFTVVRCRDADRKLQEYFLRSVTSAVLSVGPKPAAQDVRETIEALIELFRAMALPPRTSIQGLWAELFLMWQSRDPVMLARAWYSVPDERYDFGSEKQRVEVKSAANRRRVHEFALDQIRPVGDIQAIVASVFAEASAAGLSLRELAEFVRAAVAADAVLSLRFDRVLASSVGNAWRHASESRFDHELAADSLRYFPSESIPAVVLPLPSEVTHVRFRSDIGQVRPIDPARLAAQGGLFQAIVSDLGGRRAQKR